MRSRATIDETFRQAATPGETADGRTSGVRGACDGAGRAATTDRPRAARMSFAVDSHIAAAQLNGTAARLDPARQLCARGIAVDGSWTAAGPRAVDRARRRRIAVERATGSLSQTIDLARRVGRAGNAARARVVPTNDVTGNAVRADHRLGALPGAARNDAPRVVAGRSDACSGRAADSSAGGRPAGARHPTRRAAVRDGVLPIGAQRVRILNTARKDARNQHRRQFEPARAGDRSIPGTRHADHARGSVCHVAESARWSTS